MTRVEAKERYTKHVTSNRLGVFDCGWDVIDQIFDDLGRCDECKFALVFGDDPTGTIMCSEHEAVAYHPRNGFCEKFEKVKESK